MILATKNLLQFATIGNICGLNDKEVVKSVRKSIIMYPQLFMVAGGLL